jgi:toxin ParE1/3/4
MPEFGYTAQARSDLLGIVGYTIETWGQSQATEYVDGLETIAQLLAETPMLGKTREDLASKARVLSFPYGKHILYYATTSKGISILRILHESMDVETQIKKN